MVVHNAEVFRGPAPEFHPDEVRNLIDGRWETGDGEQSIPVINPASGEPIIAYRAVGPAQIAAAAVAAGRAFPLWAATPAPERYRILSKAAELMRQRVETIALDLTMEQGKPLSQARGEVLGSADVMTWFAEQGRRLYARNVPGRDHTILQTVEATPIGPVAVFTPWNSPLGTSVRTSAAALAAGCTVVLKSASETPLSAMGFVHALVDAGLPPGAINALFGRASEISQALIAHPAIRKISLTGSLAVGKLLARQAGEEIKPMTLELGGHAPVVVFDDVDIASVVSQSVVAKFDNAGQICISPSRFFVQRRVYGEFVAAMAQRISALKLGEGWVDGVDIGPLANPRRLDEVEKLVADAVEHGARLVAGGGRVGNRGYFYRPTLLADVPDHAAIMNDEPFGPIAATAVFDGEEEVIERANRLPFGLAGYAFSNDLDRLDRLGAALEVGMVGLNNFAISKPELPFTGIKQSGYGYACGEEGLDAFVVRRTVTRRKSA